MRVLIVEDKVRMAALLQRALHREGYSTMVAHDGAAALETISSCHLDAIVLDVMLPEVDGFTVLKRIRENQIAVPAILLTARDTNDDVVRGLDLGADDYLTKPFDMNVLLARVRALTRRGSLLMNSELKVGNLTLCSSRHSVECNGKSVALTPTEFALMERLMQRAGVVVRKEILAETGWKNQSDFSDETLYVFMRTLRTKIQSASQSVVLQTVRGVGYTLKVLPA